MLWGELWGSFWGLDRATLSVVPTVGGTQWVASLVAGDQPGSIEIFAASREDLPTLHRALLISLFSDRRAEADDELPFEDGDRRGWWADFINEFPIGSRLWLLTRAKVTNETANTARDYIEEALAWMITIRLATSIDVVVEVRTQDDGSKLVGGVVTINRDEVNVGGLRFSDLWTALNAAA